jgi:hypothetical protein
MSLIDEFLPNYQFSERHQTMVSCEPGELLNIVQSFKPPQDRVTDIFMFIRQMPAMLLHYMAPLRIPPPKPFTPANFVPLGRDGDRELVGGLVGQFWRPDFGLVFLSRPSELLDLTAPHTAKLTIGFHAERVGETTRLTTETRVHCPDRCSFMMFLPYWLIIRPFSGILRRRALNAIRKLAESRAALT